MLKEFRTEPTGHSPLPKSPSLKGIHEFVPSVDTNLLIASAF